MGAVAAAAVVVVAVVALRPGGASGHEALQSALDDLDLPPGLTHVVDRLTGPEECFAGDCPAVDRYLAAAGTPDEVCAAIGPLGEDVALQREEAADGCRFSGGYEGRRLTVVVTGPLGEIPAYGNTIRPTPVDVPHQAMVLLSLG